LGVLNQKRCKTIISCKLPIDLSPEIDLSPDVKYAYDNFIKSTINYFKITDNNDLLQEEYKDINNSLSLDNSLDLSCNLLDITNNDADYLLMRSIRIDEHTLDKYVKRISTKKNENIILPKHREVILTKSELKDKGIKKNITNKYEVNNTKKEDT